MNIGVIPARYASTRLPGKPLVSILGQSMIHRVWSAAIGSTRLDSVIVSTDDERIVRHVREFGGDVELTDPALPSGTDRCYATIMQRGLNPTLVVNIQGDEPLLVPDVINTMVDRLAEGDCDVTTPIHRIEADELQLPSVVKVAVTEHLRALYFTRAPIATPWKHIGLYAYTWQALCMHIQKAPSKLEGDEKLEQLRLLEAGAHFQCVVTNTQFQAVDTPADVERVVRLLSR